MSENIHGLQEAWPTGPERPLRILRTQPPPLADTSVTEIAARFGMSTGRRASVRSTADDVTFTSAGHEVTVFRATGGLRYRDRSRWQTDHGADVQIDDGEAEQLARAAVERHDLAPLEECRLAKVTRLHVAHTDLAQADTAERTVDLGVIFRRVVDDALPADGPGGYVMVYLDAEGQLTGADRLWREAGEVDRDVEGLQPPDVALDQLGRRHGGDHGATLVVEEVRLGYFEYGWRTPQTHLQPAYVILADLQSPDRRLHRRAVHVVPAATNHVGRITPTTRARPQLSPRSDDAGRGTADS